MASHTETPLPLLARRMKAARERLGISQAELGVRAGIDKYCSSARINQYERGKHSPDFLTARNLAKVLGVPTAYFYTEDDALAEIIAAFGGMKAAERKSLLNFALSVTKKPQSKQRDMPIWATHPRPQDGELLTSWIIRIAAECGLTASEFCETALSTTRRFWYDAFDRKPDPSRLHALSEGTGVPEERIIEMTHLPEEGYLFSYDGDGANRWISPTPGLKSAKSKHFTDGMAYCPECLRSDKKAYYRKLWRYSFYNICPTHLIPLRHNCPHCKKGYCNILPYAQENINFGQPITACWSCGQNICDIVPPHQWDDELIEQSLMFQNKTLAAVKQSVMDVPGHGYVFSHSYLDVQYNILNTLSHWRHANLRISYVIQMIDAEFNKHEADKGKSFWSNETQRDSGHKQGLLLFLSGWLMGEWPNRFVSYIEKCDIKRSELFAANEPSYWFYTTALPLLKAASTDAHTKEEIESATLILRARMKRPVTASEVKEFVTTGTLADHTAERKAKQIAGKRAVQAMHQKFSREWAEQRQAEKNKRLAKIITWSESQKAIKKSMKSKKLLANPMPDADEL